MKKEHENSHPEYSHVEKGRYQVIIRYPPIITLESEYDQQLEDPQYGDPQYGEPQLGDKP